MLKLRIYLILFMTIFISCVSNNSSLKRQTVVKYNLNYNISNEQRLMEEYGRMLLILKYHNLLEEQNVNED